MPDEMDIAQEFTEKHNAQVIAEHFRRGLQNAARKSAETCEACAGEIPEARQKAVPGCTRCTSCQSDFELLQNWR